MGNTELCSVRSPDSFYTSFCIQKVSGDLHYLLAKKLVNTFYLSSLMNVDFVSPEVFFFNLHLLKALKLHLYRTKVQWDITKKVPNTMDVSLSKFGKLVINREAWHAAVCGVAKSWTQLSE